MITRAAHGRTSESGQQPSEVRLDRDRRSARRGTARRSRLPNATASRRKPRTAPADGRDEDGGNNHDSRSVFIAAVVSALDSARRGLYKSAPQVAEGTRHAHRRRYFALRSTRSGPAAAVSLCSLRRPPRDRVPDRPALDTDAARSCPARRSPCNPCASAAAPGARRWRDWQSCRAAPRSAAPLPAGAAGGGGARRVAAARQPRWRRGGRGRRYRRRLVGRRLAAAARGVLAAARRGAAARARPGPRQRAAPAALPHRACARRRRD